MIDRNRLAHKFATESEHLRLNKITFRIHPVKWSVLVTMMQGMNVEARLLAESLKVGHGIDVDFDQDATLYFVFDSEMRKKLDDSNYKDPSEAQLCATSRCVGVSEQDARDKFTAQFLGDN